MNQAEKVVLFCNEGTSDKEYHASLEQSGDGWVVNYLHGRRGSALKSGTRTKEPVDFVTAKKAFDKLVKSKLADNYKPDSNSAVAYQPSTVAKDVLDGHIPQLANPVSEEELEAYFTDPLWGAQEKKDGDRRQLKTTIADSISAIGTNRKGQIVPLPMCVANDALDVKVAFHADGEAIGDVFYAFDLLSFGNDDLRHRTFEHRFAMLEELVRHIGPAVQLVPLARTEAEKRQLFATLKARNAEGIVFHKMDSIYEPGRPNSLGSVIKFQFRVRATVKVAEIHPTKRSVKITARDELGNHIAVGNVTILPNFDIPNVGDFVEVQYLYYYKNGSLFQPVYLGPRNDKDESDLISSLKLKADEPDLQNENEEVFA